MTFKTAHIFLFGLLLVILVAATSAAGGQNQDLEESSRRVRREAEKKRSKNNVRKGKKKKSKKNVKSLKSKKSRKSKSKRSKKSKSKKSNKVQGGKSKSRNVIRNRQRGQARGKGRKGRRRSQKKTRQSETVASSCFTQAIFIMNLWKDKVKNFKRQKSRMTSMNTTGGNKSGKKGTFAPIAFKLVDIGGGNKSNMSCGGSFTGAGAKQLANLTKTLFDCEVEVNSSCNPSNFPQPNTTFISSCNTLISDFESASWGAAACLNKTMGSTKTNESDACSCWTGSQLNTTALSLKSCTAQSDAKGIKQQLAKCTKAFGKCRKYEDDAIDAMSSCSKTTAQHQAKAAALKANSDALTSAKEKMSSLANSTSRRVRGSRATAASCAEVISKATALSAAVVSYPEATSHVTLAKEISGAGTLTCTDTEKASMVVQVTSMTVAITTVTMTLSAVMEQISTLTGSTVDTSSLTTASTSLTTAASSGRRRQRLVRSNF